MKLETKDDFLSAFKMLFDKVGITETDEGTDVVAAVDESVPEADDGTVVTESVDADVVETKEAPVETTEVVDENVGDVDFLDEILNVKKEVE